MLPAEPLLSAPQPPYLAFGPFMFDRGNGLLREDEREVPLPPRVLGVLDLLISRAGTVVPKQELIDTVWKDAFVTDTSLAEAISVLRQALGDDPQTPRYIQTVHRRGYRFVARVSATPASPVITRDRHEVVSIEPETSAGLQLVPWTVAFLSLTLATVAVWQHTHLGVPDSPVVRMRVEPAIGTVFDSRGPALALSPDGRLVAWSGCDSTCRLYLRPLDQLEPRVIAGTEDAAAPFFSADGRWIGFFAAGKLRKVAVAGGMPVVITDAAQPFGGVWLTDGHVIFAASEHGGLMRVSDAGGEAEALTIPNVGAGEVRHGWPALAPGGRALLFTIATAPHDEGPSRIGLMSLGQRTAWQTVIENADVAQAVSQEYIAFSRGNEIHAVAFDRARQAIAGTDQTLTGNIARAQFTASQSGAIAYLAGGEPSRPSLTWLPAGGSVATDLAALLDIAVTSDGSHIAGVSASDIWVGDVARGTTTRLTHGGTNVAPVWSGDTAAVYYATATNGPFEVWMRDSSATLPAKQVVSAAARHHHVFPSSISRDGKLIAYTESGGSTRGDVRVMNLASRAEIASVATPFDEANGRFSPDGRLLAYQSDESGRWEMYVLNLETQQRVPISSSGGHDPHWAAGANTLFYRADTTMRVTIDATGHPLAAPVAVSTPESFAMVGLADANRLLARRSGEAPVVSAVVTLEWARELQRILGPPSAVLPR